MSIEIATLRAEHAAQVAALAIWRAANPMARRTRATAICHNGGARTVFDCVCGSRHSTSTEWRGRDARHVVEWREAHDNCIIAAISA